MFCYMDKPCVMAQENTDYIRLMQKMADVVAHDIRNPLNNILLSTAQFKLETPPDKEDAAFYVDIIERNCDRINAILTDILDVILVQGLSLDTYDLTELLQEVLEEQKDRMEFKEVRCETTLNTVLVTRFDRERMKPVLGHLLENALDAMEKKGGTLTVSVQAEGPEAVLCVSDTGTGIDSDTLPHIFAPFFTTRERHRGLGLTQVKNVVEAHRGKVTVATGQGGSTFTLRLPVPEL